MTPSKSVAQASVSESRQSQAAASWPGERDLRKLTEAIARRIDKLDGWLASDIRNRAALGLLALLQLALIATHKPWLDEWQGLLIAIQPSSLGQVFAQLHYEGHPALWYLLLRGLGSLLPTRLILPGASLLMAVAVWLAVLTGSRFSRAEKLLLLASELVMFEYLTISRSLGLGVAVLFVALALWRKPAVWLPLALLPQCDFFFGVLSMMLIALRFREAKDGKTRFYVIGLLLWVVSGLAAAYSVLPAPDMASDPPRGLLVAPIVFLSQIGTLALPIQAGLHGLEWNTTYFPGIIALPLAVYFMAWLSNRSLEIRFLTLAFIGLFLVFALFVYPLYFRHVTLIAVWLIAVHWLNPSESAEVGRVWRAWLACMAAAGLVTACASFFIPFDTSDLAARKIEQLGLRDKRWIAFPDWSAIAVSGGLGRPIAGLERGCQSSFVRWDKKQVLRTSPEIVDALVKRRKELGNFYLITTVKGSLPATLAKPISKIDAGFDGLSYNLWKIGSGEVPPMSSNPCVPGLPPQPR